MVLPSVPEYLPFIADDECRLTSRVKVTIVQIHLAVPEQFYPSLWICSADEFQIRIRTEYYGPFADRVERRPIQSQILLRQADYVIHVHGRTGARCRGRHQQDAGYSQCTGDPSPHARPTGDAGLARSTHIPTQPDSQQHSRRSQPAPGHGEIRCQARTGKAGHCRWRTGRSGTQALR